MRRQTPDRESRTPEKPRGLVRREFLHRCAICAGVMALPPAWAKLAAGATQHGAHVAASAKPAPVPLEFKYLSTDEVATVEALAEQIIPADEDPGAKWAGVVHYIDLGLAGDLKQYRPVYEAGLKRLLALTAQMNTQPFPALDFTAQTRVLEKFETDDARTGSGASGREFFQLVRRHTIEGFFGDPKYGGNRETIGWKILKFEG